MQVKQFKCPNCGAAMHVVNDMPEVYCAYCGSRFIRQEQTQEDQKKSEPKVVYVRDNRAVPPRPRIRGCLLVLLLCFSFFPGIVYIIAITYQQRVWDQQYGYGARNNNNYDNNASMNPPRH